MVRSMRHEEIKWMPGIIIKSISPADIETILPTRFNIVTTPTRLEKPSPITPKTPVYISSGNNSQQNTPAKLFSPPKTNLRETTAT